MTETTPTPDTTPTPKQDEEARITSAMEEELTDEQLVQLAEGASSWGANCNKNSGC